MKTSSLVLIFTLLFIGSCKDDPDVCKVPAEENLLHYDCPNSTGPLLDAGNHELAILLPASTMVDYVGKKLTEIQIFAGILPQACKVRVYGNGTATEPGSLLYEADVQNKLQVPAWNFHQISPPVALNGNDIWISVFVTHANRQQSIGCDTGPNREGGDWLLSSADQQWRTYRQRTGESVNWNIRGVVGN
jgi:hypothetical protein